MKIAIVQFANASDVLVEICNELKLDADGWAQIAPLGDFPGLALTYDDAGNLKKEKAIQRIDRQAVINMTNSYADARGGALKFLKGAPIFNGHPDIKGYEKRYPDKNPKGVFAAVKDGGANGFIGEPVFTNEGLDLIEIARSKGKPLGMSGRWSTELIGEENGVKVYRPKEFISAGLTPTPNLPVQMLNEKDDLAEATAEAGTNQQQKQNMKKKLLEVCTALGITFANDADDAATEAALAEVQTKVAAFANEKQELSQKVEALTTEKTTLANSLETAKTETATARTDFANERTARIGEALNGAITAGKITAADRKTWEDRLAVPAQFANELAALAKLTPVVKTTVITVERNGKKVDIANEAQRTEMINELIAEEVKAGKNVENAWAAIEAKHPALFGSMKHPKIVMPK